MKSHKLMQAIQAMLGVPASITGAKKSSRAWQHDDQRLSRAGQKRLRKNAARLRNRGNPTQ